MTGLKTFCSSSQVFKLLHFSVFYGNSLAALNPSRAEETSIYQGRLPGQNVPASSKENSIFNQDWPLELGEIGWKFQPFK